MASCYLVWFFCGTRSCPFSRIFLGRRLIFEEVRKPIKKEGALDFKVFRSFVICRFNYLKEHLILKRCASCESIFARTEAENGRIQDSYANPQRLCLGVFLTVSSSPNTLSAW